ncbi:MAG: SPOR domain-containing protein [Syntrophales bacterium]|nr:SPOR domain-containing protein [Syntrophales bacterium]
MAPRNTRTFEFKLGKRGFILFIFGISLLLFFVYVFGVMVGKNIDTYPEKLSWGIPDMVKKRLGFSYKPDKTETVAAVRERMGGSTAEEDFDLTFYDTLTRKWDERRGVILEGSKEKKPAIPQAEQRKDKRPPLPAVTEHSREKTPPVKEKYLVQVVSYREKEKADRLCKRLKVLGYNPGIVTTELPGRGRWFRVILGGFETRQEAQKVVGVVSKKIAGLSCVIRSTNGPEGSGEVQGW